MRALFLSLIAISTSAPAFAVTFTDCTDTNRQVLIQSRPSLGANLDNAFVTIATQSGPMTLKVQFPVVTIEELMAFPKIDNPADQPGQTIELPGVTTHTFAARVTVGTSSRNGSVLQLIPAQSTGTIAAPARAVPGPIVKAMICTTTDNPNIKTATGR